MTVIETPFDLSVLEVWFVKYLSRWIMELYVVERQWDELPSSALGNNKFKKSFIPHFAIISDKTLKLSEPVKELLSILNHFVTENYSNVRLYSACVSTFWELV